jgi:hypothetical protein
MSVVETTPASSDGFAARRDVLWASVLLGTVAAVWIAYQLGRLAIVLGSEEGRWTYVYLQGYQPRFAYVFARAALICGAALLVPFRIVRRYEWLAVLGWLAVGLAVQSQIRQETRYSFEQIFVSDGANSFYTPTLKHGALEVLRDFERLRRELPTHARSNMPGKLLFVSALEHLSPRPATIAWIVVVISNLGAVLLYLFVRDLFDDPIVAYLSLILYLFVPAKLYFFPVLNTITPVLILACVWLWQRALASGRASYAASVGVAGYSIALFDPLALVMGLMLVALTWWEVRRRRRSWQDVLRLAGTAAAVFAAVYVAMRAWPGFDLLKTFRAVAADAASFNVEARRPYGIWVWRNILDFLFGIGIAQAVLACVTIAYAAYRAASSGWRDAFTLYCVAIGSVLLVTDVIGVNRGEVVRLWVFLACFFQVPAAYVCTRLHSRAAVLLILCTTLLQDILGTAMFNFAQP